MKPRLLPALLQSLVFTVCGISSSHATTFNWTGGVDGNGTIFAASAGYGNWSPTLTAADIQTGTSNDFIFATRTNGGPSAPIGNGAFLTMGNSPRMGLLKFDDTAGHFPAVLTLASSTPVNSVSRDIFFDLPDTTAISLENSVTTTVKIGTGDGNDGRFGFRLPASGATTFHVANAAATLDLSGLFDNATSRGGISSGDVTQTLSHARIRKTGAGTLDLRTSDGQGNRGLGTTVLGGTVVISTPLQLGWVPITGFPMTDHIVINGGTIRLENSTVDWSSTRTVQVGASGGTLNAAGTTDMTILSPISDVTGEAGALVKSGPGTLALSVGNSFTGGLTISEGVLSVPNTTPLGSTAALNPAAVVINGGTLRFTGGGATSTSVANRGFSIGSSTGTIQVADAARTIGIDGILTDVASQAGHLAKTGPGTLALNVANTFTGGLTITEGIVSVSVAGGLGSAAAVNTNGVIISGGTVRYSGTGAIASSANRGYRLGAAGATIEVTDVAKAVTINGTLRNVLTETGTLVKTGLGTLAFASDTNSYTGTTTVSAGTLLLSTADILTPAAMASPVIVGLDGSFGGVGIASGGVTVTGKLIPGPSTLNTPGTLQIGGALVLNQGSNTTFEILDSVTADKITGPATASLDGIVTVTLLSGFEPAIGNSFDLLDSTAAPVLGPNFAFALPALATGKAWNTIAFATTGVISVVSSGGLTPYETWAGNYSLTGLDAAATADPDKDGFTNLQEFSFGSNPTTTTGSQVSMVKSGANALVTYIERNTDVTYTVKSSTTLGAWTTATGLTYLGGVDQTGVSSGYTRKQFTSLIGTKDFFRVESTTQF